MSLIFCCSSMGIVVAGEDIADILDWWTGTKAFGVGRSGGRLVADA